MEWTKEGSTAAADNPENVSWKIGSGGFHVLRCAKVRTVQFDKKKFQKVLDNGQMFFLLLQKPSITFFVKYKANRFRNHKIKKDHSAQSGMSWKITLVWKKKVCVVHQKEKKNHIMGFFFLLWSHNILIFFYLPVFVHLSQYCIADFFVIKSPSAWETRKKIVRCQPRLYAV